jgi:hypothetical protein
MKKHLTDEEWVKLIRIFCKNLRGKKYKQRAGQAYMNALHTVNNNLYKEITDTDADCFYNDELIINFIRRLNK